MSIWLPNCACVAAFPSFMCARERLVLSRSPVYNSHSSSVSSDQQTPHHMQRYLPPVSVFQATESRFNDDFTQLAIKVTSAFGMTGWITTSFHKTLIEVEDPRGNLQNAPVYMQNVAAKAGKWAGELPVRAIPSLQAPRLYNVENFRIVRALERKLVKDQVWVRIEPFQHDVGNQASNDHNSHDADSKSDAESESSIASRDSEREGKPEGDKHQQAWIIERNASTAQRVVVPWSSPAIEDVPIADDKQRYYRNLYSRRPLPLRTSADLQSAVVGHIQPGLVFTSTRRVLNSKGQMWIRVALSDVSTKSDAEEDNNADNDDDATQYGYVIQSNAKTNTCMVQEIAAPGKLNPNQHYQVVISLAPTKTGASNNDADSERSAPDDVNGVAARSEPSSTEGKDLFYVKDGAIVAAVGTMFNPQEQRMWLQVLSSEIDSSMRIKQDKWALTDQDESQSVIYLPLCDPTKTQRPTETVLKPLHRELEKISNPRSRGHDGKTGPSRVVFSGRASKLFSSHLMRPSTIDLPTFSRNDASKFGDDDRRPAAAAGEDQSSRNQSLRDEIARWQQETTSRVGVAYANVNWALLYAANCVLQPFSSCLAKRHAQQRYAQLDQDEDDDDEALPDHEVNV